MSLVVLGHGRIELLITEKHNLVLFHCDSLVRLEGVLLRSLLQVTTIITVVNILPSGHSIYFWFFLVYFWQP